MNRMIVIVLLAFAACFTGVAAAQSPAPADFLVGNYENHLYDKGGKTDWHYVQITKVDATHLKWTNRAKASWTLTLDANDRTKAAVGADCPYYAQGYRIAQLNWNALGVVIGISGPNNEAYERDPAQVALANQAAQAAKATATDQATAANQAAAAKAAADKAAADKAAAAANDARVTASKDAASQAQAAAGINWTKFGGARAVDVGVGTEGSIFYVAADGSIYQGNGTPNGWTKANGGAKRIAIDSFGAVWIVASDNRLLRMEKNAWVAQPRPGGRGAADVGAGADGSVWITDTANNLVYIQVGRSGAKPNGTDAKRVAVDPAGSALIVTSRDTLAKVDKDTGTLIEMPNAPAKIIDVAVGKNSNHWAIDASGKLYGLVSWDRWAQIDTGGLSLVAISADNLGNPWAVDSTGTVYRGTLMTPLAGRSSTPGSVPVTATTAATTPTVSYTGKWAKAPTTDVTGSNVQRVCAGSAGCLTQIDAFAWTDGAARYDEVGRDAGAVTLDLVTSNQKTAVVKGGGLNAGKLSSNTAGRSITVSLADKKTRVHEDKTNGTYTEQDFNITASSSVSGYLVSRVVFGRNGKKTGALAVDGEFKSKTWWATYEDGSQKKKFDETSRTPSAIVLKDAAGKTLTVDLERGAIQNGAGQPEDDLLQTDSVTGFNVGTVVTGESLNNSATTPGGTSFVKTGLKNWQEVVKAAPQYRNNAPIDPLPSVEYSEARVTDTLLVLVSKRTGNFLEIDLEKKEIRMAANSQGNSMATPVWRIQSVAPAITDLLDPVGGQPKPNIARKLGPGFQIYNATDWPLTVSIGQVGPLYYALLNPNEVMERTTASVWYGLKVQPSPDGVCHITDKDVAMPIVEIVGSILLAAVTGGYGAFAAGGAIAGGTTASVSLSAIAEAALVNAAKTAVLQGIKAGTLKGEEIALSGQSPEVLSIVQTTTSFALSMGKTGLEQAAAGSAFQEGAIALGKTTGKKLAEELLSAKLSDPKSTPEAIEGRMSNELSTLTKKGGTLTPADFLEAGNGTLGTITTAPSVAPPILYYVGNSEYPMSTPQGAAEGAALFSRTTVSLESQYAGYAWPFRTNKPVYWVTGGPRKVVSKIGNQTIIRFYPAPFKITLLMK